MATQKDIAMLDRLKKETFYTYLLMCEQLQEVPRKDIILLVNGCADVQALKDTRALFLKRIV